MDEAKLDDAKRRAEIISNRIRSRADELVRRKIMAFQGNLSWDRGQLGIDEEAWRHVQAIKVNPALVFAHPDVLCAHPDASLHYRGIATLSLKRVQQIAGSVAKWEEVPSRARVTQKRVLKVARLYNFVISSVIRNSTEWTLENGYRNVLATIGITLDGALRNVIGQEAELAVKERILEWLKSQSDTPCKPESKAETWRLGKDNALRMTYSSEPDICFEERLPDGSWEVVSTIEIKGGLDPAGALERLGAVKKSFDQTPTRAKNFLIVGVVTEEMRKQLGQMQIEKFFLLNETLHNDAEWTKFINEVFHHALRLLEAPY
ncbi:MAG: XcyI family restriction endonuclease [Gammaproteobacteria bacterium]|nr:XcyI family restriction endonuclease [Gammaproteobacteria bacterium]